MSLKRIVVGSVFGALVSLTVQAETLTPVVRGTAGLVAVPFQADNAGATDMHCAAILAHWYSQDLGTAGGGTSVRGVLWSDPTDGEVFLLNDHQDRMPVQTLWCGAGERAWLGRSAICLEHRAGVTPLPIHVVCSPEGDGLSCR